MNLNASDAKAVDLILNGLDGLQGSSDTTRGPNEPPHHSTLSTEAKMATDGPGRARGTAGNLGANGGRSVTDGNGNKSITTNGGFQPYATTHGTAPAMSDDLANRIDHAEGLLRLLDAWPAADPPDGLVDRTLGRISEAEHRPHQHQPLHPHEHGGGATFGYTPGTYGHGGASASGDASARHTMRKPDPS